MAADPTIRNELFEATDSTIGYADPSVLRGLIHQLIGDPEVLATRSILVITGFGQAPVVEYADVSLLRRKAVEYVKAWREKGAPAIDIGPADRLRVSLGLTVGIDVNRNDIAALKSSKHLRAGCKDIASAIVTAVPPGITMKRIEIFPRDHATPPLSPLHADVMYLQLRASTRVERAQSAA